MLDPVQILPAVCDVGVCLPLRLPLWPGERSSEALKTLLVEVQALLLVSGVRPDNAV